MMYTGTNEGFSFQSTISNLQPLLSYTLPSSFPQSFNHRSDDFHFPLDLSLRNGPITPPSTPSPPRKKIKVNAPENVEHGIQHNVTQFIGTISENDKRYFSNSVKSISTGYFKIFNESSVFESNEKPTETNPGAKKIVSSNDTSLDENSCEDFIDITGSDDNVAVLSNLDKISIDILNENESVEEISKPEKYESSNDDEFVDVESHDSDIIYGSTSNNEEDRGILVNGKMHFDNPKYHSEAIEGFAKLFEKDFGKGFLDTKTEDTQSQKQSVSNKFCKSERRRIKSRKQIMDEENTSPVSGTIIRKLLDGEELVVRKGDIDPCFNVVEVTEEAKANLGN